MAPTFVKQGLFGLVWLMGIFLPALGAPSRCPRAPTCNKPTNRTCWTDGFDINTDYEANTPTTGVTQSYTFTVTEVDNWIGGDGVAKAKAMLINGQFPGMTKDSPRSDAYLTWLAPGPTVTADWGDTISITVVNNLVTNGTSIHWHGLHLPNTQDGTSGLTECPIPPGSSKTYTFLARQYGTSWYHSHASAQYGNGVLGPIVINGPASTNYDIDLGPFPITDWYYGGVDAILHRVNDPSDPFTSGLPGAAPNSDNVLFNGTNRDVTGTTGSYARVTLTPGKVHLLRLINPSVENTYTVALANHNLTVIATDLVPVMPQTVSSLYLAVGQRYDVLINASQPADNYWFNITFSAGPCGASNNVLPAAIFSYAGAPDGNPTAEGTAPPDTHCAQSASFTPVVSRTAPVTSFTPDARDTLTTTLYVNSSIARVFWPVNGSPMNISWNDPTLKYVQAGTVSSLPSTENVVSVPTADTWTFWLIQNNSSIPHPIHLHGHDLLVLGSSPALADPFASDNILRTFNPATDTLQGSNPERRDTTILPSWGWLALAFYTNSPGAWLMHCHVAWHVSQGLGVQFLEQVDAIPGAMDLGVVTSNCANWDAYFPAQDPYQQQDSGI